MAHKQLLFVTLLGGFINSETYYNSKSRAYEIYKKQVFWITPRPVCMLDMGYYGILAPLV